MGRLARCGSVGMQPVKVSVAHCVNPDIVPRYTDK